MTAGGATLTIPAGALSQDTTITVTISRPSSSLPESATVKGSVFGSLDRTERRSARPRRSRCRWLARRRRTSARSSHFSTRPPTGGSRRPRLSRARGSARRYRISRALRSVLFRPWSAFPARTRTWEFHVSSRNESFLLPEPEGHGTQVGGEDMFHHHDFGEHIFDIDDDGIASLEAFSSASGITFWVSADAPLAGDPINKDRLIFGESVLFQYQSFIKHAPDATLRFRVTRRRWRRSIRTAPSYCLPSANSFTIPTGRSSALGSCNRRLGSGAKSISRTGSSPLSPAKR